MKVINIDDFSGGKNVWDSQLTVKEGQCTVSSYNVWAPKGVLTKTPGVSIFQTLTASGSATDSCVWIHSESTVSSAFKLYHRISSGAQNENIYLWGGETD